MKYFQIRPEGNDINHGFNIYPLSGNQFGFIFQSTDYKLICYWSKCAKRLRFKLCRSNLEAERKAYREFMSNH